MSVKEFYSRTILQRTKALMTMKTAVAGAILIFIACALTNLFYFFPQTSVAELGHILTNYNPDNLIHHVTLTIKLPRLIGAVMVGAMLAVGGAVMQGITRNYLASPDVVGVDSGAGLGLSIAMALTGGATSYWSSITFSMLGAACAMGVIFFVSSRIRGNESSIKLLLAGSALGMMFSGIAKTIDIASGMGQSINVWNNSGLLGIQWVAIGVLLLGISGMALGFAIAGRITVLGMGDETAVSLGQNVRLTKLLGIASVVLISSATVCTVGNIGFVGLVIPNMVKMAVGEDYRKVIPLSALFGSLLLMAADVASRLVNYPAETPIGTITSILGIPIFLYLINSKRHKGGLE